MRGFPTTTLLLAAALGGSVIALDELASSAPASVDLHGNVQTIITTDEPDILMLQAPVADEILDDMIQVEEEEEDSWWSQPTDDLTEVEYLQLMINQLKREIDARGGQFHNADDAPESMLGSAFHKIVRFLTSFGAGNDETDLLYGGKGGWHWPKFPFPPHHGRGNHTHGNHTFPPPHHGHGNHTFPPRHGNHTHHGHGNHTHGNHTHPPHHPPFRLPPHFCRPPHHKPPHHKPPHHKPTPLKKPDDDVSPPPGNLEPPYQRPGEDPVFVSSQRYDSALSSVLTTLNYPLLDITITPGSLILTSMLCLLFIRMFRRIRAVASRKRYHRYQRRQRLLQARQGFQDFINRSWSWAGRHDESTQDEKMAPPGYYDHNDPYDDDDSSVCNFGFVDDGILAQATWDRDAKVLFGDDCLKNHHQPDLNNVGREFDEKAAMARTEVDDVVEKQDEDLMSMSEEIASFREVANLVSDMVAAEEGRAVSVGEKK